MNDDEWSIQQIARIAGTTSRTLRHYGDIGLLPASSVGDNGYRHYDRNALVRLQRILLLRDLGLGLAQIAQVLDRDGSQESALTGHLAWLRQEQDRLARQIASVQSTIEAVRGGERLMAENMFDGFDHTPYQDEVTERWGESAYADGDRWWRGLSTDEKAAFHTRVSDLSRDWVAAAESGVAPDSPEAAALARRHVEWLTGVPGTPATAPGGDVKGYVIGLGEMYVADERFGAQYESEALRARATAAGGSAGAEFVRDALRSYAEANL